jgi:hypothetical protein
LKLKTHFAFSHRLWDDVAGVDDFEVAEAKSVFCDGHHIASATAELVFPLVDRYPAWVSGSTFLNSAPLNAGLSLGLSSMAAVEVRP